ncbi:MAG: hypothetical protein BGO96_14030 [Micrococcales bacterium 73-15]|uniref:hypothetical protein n=1 Tax=Salana multivorans TaxID=120377 RepID=UPI00095F8B60|nr:hypothetical protein [Salana multivorans]OJX97999.1 MAG: hypothetical protein BGO96_14030 [Micrococcales bacterium 73-15]
MVATLARLRFQILRNSLRRESWRLILLILGGLYALSVVGLVVAGAFALGVTVGAEARGDLLVLVGSLLVLGWIVIPVLAFGMDNTLDPQRFAVYVAPSPRLALGLLVGGAVSIPGLATVLASLALSIAWLGSGGFGERVLGFVVALLGGVLGALLCLVLARLSTTAGAGLMRARRGREVASLIGFVLVMALAFTPSLLQSFTFSLTWESIETPARVLAWTPLGAAWALPADAVAGSWLVLIARLALVVATLVVAYLGYLALLRRSMTTVGSGGGPSGQRTSRLPFAHRLIAWFGDGPGIGAGRSVLGLPLTRGTAAVAGRSLRYWRSDPRYVASAGSIVLMPLLAVLLAFVISNQDGIPRTSALAVASLLVAPIAAWFGSWSISNDVAYDSTAFALHVTTGVRGAEDRLGRVLGVAVWLVPVCLVLAAVPPAILGRSEYVPAVLGGTLALLGAGFGTASIASVLVPYPAPPPGSNPMASQQGSVGLTMVAQLGSFLAMAVLVAPTALTLIPTIGVGATWGWLTFAVGVATGVICFVLGIRLGGRLYDQRAVAVLDRIKSWPKH